MEISPIERVFKCLTIFSAILNGASFAERDSFNAILTAMSP